MPPQRNSVAHSALWNHAGKLSEHAAWFFSSVLIARGLGAELNGTLAGMMSAINLLLALSSIGLEVALNKALPQLNPDDIASRVRAVVRRAASARLILSLGFTAVAAVVVGQLLAGRPGFAHPSFLVLLLYGALRGLASLAAVVLVARWKTHRAAVITGATRMLELSVLAILYRSGMSVVSVVVVLTATMALQVIGYVMVGKENWFGYETRVPMRPIWMLGTIYWANTLVDYFLGRQGDIFFLTLLSPFASSSALYDVSYSVLQAGSLVVTAGFTGVTLAAFAKLALGDRHSMDGFYGSLVRIISLLTIPVLGFLLISAADIIQSLYSESYSGAVIVLQVMLAFRIFSRLFAGGENGDYLLALNKPVELVVIGVVGAGVTVLLHLILIPRFDVVGAAWAAGIGTLTANMLASARVRKHGTARIEWRTWGIVTGATIVAGLLSTLVPVPAEGAMKILVQGCVFGGVFLSLAALFRPLDAEDATAARSLPFVFQRAMIRLARTNLS